MIDNWPKTIPTLTRDQMVEVDRSMIEDFGIELLQMMENAGRHLAHLTRDRFLGGDARDKAVTVLAGTGGNGGGALVAARRGYRIGVPTSKLPSCVPRTATWGRPLINSPSLRN